MSIVTSKDGTTIAFDAWGEGQPLILVDGATAHRAVNPTNAAVGQLLGEELRVYDAVADGRPGAAVELFLTAAAGLPAEAIAGVRQSPLWPALEAVAGMIAYDGRIMGTTMSGGPLPRDRWAAVTVPVLVMHGNATAPWLIAAARALAELLPTASLQAVQGQQHSAAADVLAPALRRFAQAR